MSKKESKVRDVWVKEIAARSMGEAFARMDEWGNSFYDMYLVYQGEFEEQPGYTLVRLIGWEHNNTRSDYAC